MSFTSACQHRRTEQAYVGWIRRYVYFHARRQGRFIHPGQLGTRDAAAFLGYLAQERHVAASTQNQALNALVFLYKHVLGQPLGDLGYVPRAKRSRRLPVVLSRAEVGRLLGAMPGSKRLMASLLYGSARASGGLRQPSS